MNPIIWAANMLSELTRVCPKCKKEQVVPPTKIHKSVPCKSCGAEVPPRK
jgi:ribosomal protein S27E